jgi:hypothetical protein
LPFAVPPVALDHGSIAKPVQAFCAQPPTELDSPRSLKQNPNYMRREPSRESNGPLASPLGPSSITQTRLQPAARTSACGYGSPLFGKRELHCRAGTALSEFLLQGPISAFVGTTAIGTNFDDVPLVENLGFGTRCVLVSPGIRCRASDCPRSVANLAEGLWLQHR